MGKVIASASMSLDGYTAPVNLFETRVGGV
jgi:hypothetical protein